jgi:aryl-alcohol dehydrogenase-like predicted oxidoreductase
MTRQIVEANIARSLRRMDVTTLDLLQFHWWEYADPNYLEALMHLSHLRDAGHIKHLALTPFCQEHGITLLTYGTFCGGLLSDAYLAQPEPRGAALHTASLRKYKQMIDAWGGWALFQQLLHTLRQIADKHQVSIANVAARYILDRPAVAGVIVGVRLGVTDHRLDNARVFDVTLDQDDQAQIGTVLAQAHDLYRLIGDCGDEYRR